MKSNTDWPTSGLTNAVQKPHNAAQSSTGRMGLTNTIIAIITSATPIKSNRVAAVSLPTWVIWLIQPTQSFFPPMANRPCPINSPATPTRSSHSIFLSFVICFVSFNAVLSSIKLYSFSILSILVSAPRLLVIFLGVPEGNRTLVTAATERRSAIELRAPWISDIKKLLHRFVKSRPLMPAVPGEIY